MRGADRDDFVVELAGFLRGGGTLLALQRVFVLRFAADAVTLRDRFGGLQHRHVDRAVHVNQLGIGHHAHFFGLHEADRFLPTGGHHVHAVGNDLLGGGGDAHQAARTLAVDGHAAGADRATGAQRDLAGEVSGLRTLLERAAPQHVVDLAGVDAGTLDRGLERIGAERRALGVVEPALVGTADGGAGGGDDDCVTHGYFLGCGCVWILAGEEGEIRRKSG